MQPSIYQICLCQLVNKYLLYKMQWMDEAYENIVNPFLTNTLQISMNELGIINEKP